MNAINQAIEHGYTHVRTLAGPVPLNEWQPLDEPATFDPSEAALLGEWRGRVLPSP